MVRFLIYFSFIFLIGCGSAATNLSHYTPVDKGVMSGNYDVAIRNIQSRDGYDEKEKVLYYLDLGMVYHYAGKYAESNEALEKAERSIDELYTKSVSKAALSYMLNDNALEYSGEDYEDIYINLIKAFNYLKLGMVDDAFIEINRLNHKLSVLEAKNRKLDNAFNKSKDSKVKIDSPTNKFYNDALGRFVSMKLYESLGKLDDANIDYDKIEKAFAVQTSIYDFNAPSLQQPYTAPKDKVALSLVSFAGLGPIKVAKSLYVHTQPNIAFYGTSQTNSGGSTNLNNLEHFFWPGLQGGYNFKFQLPILQSRSSNVNRVEVLVMDSVGVIARQDLQLMEDFDKVVQSVFELGYKRLVIKTITRAVVKGIAGELAKRKAKEKLGNDNILVFLGGLALDAGLNATENADLRAARYLPSKGYISEIYLEPGVYDLVVNYYDRNNNLLKQDDLGKKRVGFDLTNFYQSYCLE